MGSISITINSNESWEEWLPRNFTTVQVADRELASKITNRQMAAEIHILSGGSQSPKSVVYLSLAAHFPPRPTASEAHGCHA